MTRLPKFIREEVIMDFTAGAAALYQLSISEDGEEEVFIYYDKVGWVLKSKPHYGKHTVEDPEEDDFDEDE